MAFWLIDQLRNHSTGEFISLHYVAAYFFFSMTTVSPDFKKRLLQLTDKELVALIARAARRDDEFYETLRFELMPDVDVASIQAETEDRIHELFNLSVSGYLLHKSLPKVVGKAVKEVARARRITKNKQLEVDLTLYILRLIFRNYTGSLDSSHDQFYKATARLTVRVAGLIVKNLHEDYWLEYKPEVDDFFRKLRAYDNRWSLSFDLPSEMHIAE